MSLTTTSPMSSSTSSALSQLTIGWSSLAERTGAITIPDGADEVEVIVAVQGGLDRVHPLHGWDRLIDVPGRGVARSRNAVIEATTRRYLLFCDDDVQVDLEGVAAGIEYLSRSGSALALGLGTTPDGVVRKRRPMGGRERLTSFSAARAATYEMLVDVEQVKAAGVRFDERFGAGVDLYLGDEYLFIFDLFRAGRRADAIDHVYGIHPADSSGHRWGAGDARVRAAVLNRAFGWKAPIVRLAFANRHAEKLGGWRAAARFALDGTRP
ncbi:glycosyltransferase [Janibacter limosus]|uniref:glycosyltransferase n=1 Tax=Janibacter limosus TaxID=53458 RepID=UPI00082F4B5F|nr:glycosyltransferase [Janibacter limosus]